MIKLFIISAMASAANFEDICTVMDLSK